MSLPNNIHFIGIGGVSMNALALCLKSMGHTVTGSDRTRTETTDMLIKSGITVSIGHAADNIKNAEAVIYNAAISNDNPELAYAKQQNLQLIERPALLGQIIQQYPLPIGIAGTHGKTTVTSMISAIFITNNSDPTVMVGGSFSMISGTLRLGKGSPFIFEACEYCNSFFNFNPKMSVITNIEPDHLDFFKDIDDIISSFKKYINQVDTIIANTEDENVLKALQNTDTKTITFGIDKGDFTASNITNENTPPSFDLIHKGTNLGRISLCVYGKHNIKNALAAAACSYTAGVSFEDIQNGLNNYKGTSRRFEFIKEVNGVKIIDDYAHHPTEVRATIDAAKKYTKGKIITVFQPHTYTRVEALYKDFAKELQECDHVILAKIYAAREKSIDGVTSKLISGLIENAVYIEDFNDIAAHIKKISSPGDTVITMGAGDINSLITFL